ncbi:MAG: hypothetical protein J6X28_04975 [Bacilli bacterium]|nr:hypothetical protein [Bacilli bacterium]
MNDHLAFNTEKLQEVEENLKEYYQEYRESVLFLNTEIQRLAMIWGMTNASLYNEFKGKFDEKKEKLNTVENMMKELIDTLEAKKLGLEEASLQSENNFE